MIRPHLVDPIRTKLTKFLSKLTGQLNDKELVLLWALVGFDIGRSIHGQEITNTDQLIELHKDKPTIATALMLQSMIAKSWTEETANEQTREGSSSRSSTT